MLRRLQDVCATLLSISSHLQNTFVWSLKNVKTKFEHKRYLCEVGNDVKIEQEKRGSRCERRQGERSRRVSRHTGHTPFPDGHAPSLRYFLIEVLFHVSPDLNDSTCGRDDGSHKPPPAAGRTKQTHACRRNQTTRQKKRGKRARHAYTHRSPVQSGNLQNTRSYQSRKKKRALVETAGKEQNICTTRRPEEQKQHTRTHAHPHPRPHLHKRKQNKKAAPANLPLHDFTLIRGVATHKKKKLEANKVAA